MSWRSSGTNPLLTGLELRSALEAKIAAIPEMTLAAMMPSAAMSSVFIDQADLSDSRIE